MGFAAPTPKLSPWSDLDAGLERLVPREGKRGYLELGAGASTLSGPFARAEAGWLLLPNLGTFAQATVGPGQTGVGVGVRWTF